MGNRKKEDGHQFAMEFLDDVRLDRIMKDCMMNHSDDFSGGMEKLHRERFNRYLSSCGRYLMDRRLGELEEGYCG